MPLKNKTQSISGSAQKRDQVFRKLQELLDPTQTTHRGVLSGIPRSLGTEPELLDALLPKNNRNLLFSTDQFSFEFARKQVGQKRLSEFGNQLRERKKLSLYYGTLSLKYLRGVYQEALRRQGHVAKNFFALLEQRLDVVLFRSRFATSIPHARQLIHHGKVSLNQRLAKSPSQRLQPGDILLLGTPLQNATSVTSIRLEGPIGSNNIAVQPLSIQGNNATIALQELSRLVLQRVHAVRDHETFGPITVLGGVHRGTTTGFGNPRRGQTLRTLLNTCFRVLGGDPELLELQKIQQRLPQRVSQDWRGMLNRDGMKPLHLEISRAGRAVIYLFAPQRLYFPFAVDMDRLLGSLK